jgi:outer membrane protein OmpA-like peptidoglycan-associated protein
LPNQITIIGHADQAGPQSYNLNLSRQRANAVKEALVSQGVPENIIRIEAKGETAPLVQTGGNMREPANRRVDVSFDRDGA